MQGWVDGMTATYTLTGSELIAGLSSGGLDAEWACLGGDWFGIYVGDSDCRSCIITGGGGGREWTTPDRQSFPSDPLTDGGVGFYDGGGWVADSSAWLSAGADDPTATVAGCVAVVRSWIHDGDLPDGLVDGR